MKKINLIQMCIIFLFTTIIGCASGSTIMTGKAKPSINPSEVKIYLETPQEFETIALIEASSTIEFSRQSAQDRVIQELKNRAAKIGANGILLTKSGSQNSGSTGFFFNDTYSSSSTESITGQGKAIFVINE
jgi:hypothetical protein